MGVGVTAVVLMFFIGQGQWLFAAILFVLANIGANGSFVFYDALLPHVAPTDEMDRVSTAGYAMGYIGGGLLLAVSLAFILNPGWLGIPTGEDVSPALSWRWACGGWCLRFPSSAVFPSLPAAS